MTEGERKAAGVISYWLFEISGKEIKKKRERDKGNEREKEIEKKKWREI